MCARCQGGFNEFAVKVFSSKWKAVASELLSDCAGSFAKSTQEKVADNSARDADRIHTVMLIKPRILATDQGIDKKVGDLVKGNHLTVLAG